MSVAKHGGRQGKTEHHKHHDYRSRELVGEQDRDDDHQCHRKSHILAADDTRRVKWRDHEQEQSNRMVSTEAADLPAALASHGSAILVRTIRGSNCYSSIRSPPEAQSNDGTVQDQVEVVFIGATVLAIVDRQGAIADHAVKV